MAKKLIRKAFEYWKGLDPSRTVITKGESSATVAKNIYLDDALNVCKRKGFKPASPHGGTNQEYPGLTLYKYLDRDNQRQTKIVNFGKQDRYGGCQFLTPETLTIDVTTSVADDITINFYPVSGEWELDVKEGASSASGFPKQYGTGTEGSPDLMSTLATDISGITGVTATASDGTVPAATLPILNGVIITKPGAGTNTQVIDYFSMDYTVSARKLPVLVSPDVTNFKEYVKVSTVVARDVVLSGTAGKFDGNSHVAGIGRPRAEFVSIADAGSGTTHSANVTFKYKMRLRWIDNRDNIIYGPFSAVNEHTTGGSATDIDITTGGASQDYYDCRAAIVSGAQTASTITVSSSDLAVGDIVFISDGIKDPATESYEVTGVTLSTVTLDSSVTVANNDIIHNRATIEIYRTKEDSDIFYLVDELADYGLAGRIYTDSVSDSTIESNGRLIERDFELTAPPTGTVNAMHQSIHLLSGITSAGDYTPAVSGTRVFFSDVGEPEHFSVDNYIDIPFRSGREVVGLASHEDVVAVFTRDEYALIRGDLSTGDVFVDIGRSAVGCTAHASICHGERGLYWMSYQGPQRMVNGVLDEGFNIRITNLFNDIDFEIASGEDLAATGNDQRIYVKRAVSFYDYRHKRVIFYIPALSGEEGSTDGLYPNSNSKWYIYDEKNDAWFEWVVDHEIAPEHGIIINEGKMYLSCVTGPTPTYGTRYGQIFTENDSMTNQFQPETGDDPYDYADNVTAIDADLRPQWEILGEPSVYKKFIRTRIWSTDENRTSDNHVPWTLDFADYRDFDDSNAKTSVSVDFTSSSTIESRQKLKPGKARSWQPRFRNSTIHEGMMLTGYEVEVALLQSGEEVEKS